MGTLVKATDIKGSQTPGTNVPAKLMQGNSALAQMLHVSAWLYNAICILETDSLEVGGVVWGSEIEIAY